jgi:hypothetical protein
MKICIVRPEKDPTKFPIDCVQEIINGQFDALGLLTETTKIEDLSEALKHEKEFDFFFIYSSREAIEFANNGNRKFIYHLNELEAYDTSSKSYLDCKYAIDKSLFSFVPSVTWIRHYKEFRNKILYLSRAVRRDKLSTASRLSTFERPDIDLSNIKLLCLGKNDKSGEDKLNYILCNYFANKFGLSISFVNAGCDYFSNTEYNFFEANQKGKCSITCEYHNIFEEQRSDTLANIIQDHDILLDFSLHNLESPSIPQLKASLSGMPTISSHADVLPDSENAIYQAEPNIASMTSAFQKIIENWKLSVDASRQFASNRNWTDATKSILNILTKIKNG